MVKLVDTLDLKSSEQQCSCGFKSRSEYKKASNKCLELFYFISKLVLWFVLNLVRGLEVKVRFVNSESLGFGILKNGI